jgi:uncharacterized protein YehS (DUF1456 family)
VNNNELLRSIKNALQLDEGEMIAVFREAGREVGAPAIAAFLKTAEEDGHIPCANPIMGFFLDGLIIRLRGRKEGGPEPAEPLAALGNNTILKKLRIALDLKEDELIDLFHAGGTTITKHDLTALFRKKGHKHYKRCSDQLLGSFIEGVALQRKG